MATNTEQRNKELMLTTVAAYFPVALTIRELLGIQSLRQMAPAAKANAEEARQPANVARKPDPLLAVPGSILAQVTDLS